MEKELSQEPVISTSRLTKAFDTRVAVSDLHLEVLRGDVFGFLGPNGSGKTTTIRMLLGLIQPTVGSISLFGLDNSTHLWEVLPRIGAMVETPVFYPYLSGLDNLRMVAAASGMRLGKANQARIDEVLDLVDLSTRGRDAYRKYSMGMKQRLAIGAALLTDPELILLDEPTNGLDPAGVHEIRQLILRLSSIGKTIFLSSHILYEIQQVCNRVAILQQGKLLKQGNVQELLREGKRLVVRLGTPEETGQAQVILQQAAQRDMNWIAGVSSGTDKNNLPALFVDAPAARSQEIIALLARRDLFIAEMYQSEASLEDFYLELTGTDAGEGSRAAMVGMTDLTNPSHPLRAKWHSVSELMKRK
ncbi:MAG TPA: ABC transporter ATP-binding protein [Ktedonobacteraceae bacterium]|nr:ABC transporter ATP-binding protein [Ktedonobacteraceae bacterium]